MQMRATVLSCLLLLPLVAAINVAVANIRGSTAVTPVSGWVRFEQDETDPLADVTVRINVTGLPAGEHGFHVHQYGDVRSTSDLSTMAAHFVPFCIPPEVAPGGGTQQEGGCEQDQRHGIPPSVTRQPGDMGNIVVGASRTVQQTLTIGQQKMSLSHELRSIVGRTVVFHSLRDDGSQPYGNAGAPQAYGVIGMARPTVGAANAALAPTVPKVDKLIFPEEDDIRKCGDADEIHDEYCSEATNKGCYDHLVRQCCGYDNACKGRRACERHEEDDPYANRCCNFYCCKDDTGTDERSEPWDMKGPHLVEPPERMLQSSECPLMSPGDRIFRLSGSAWEDPTLVSMPWFNETMTLGAYVQGGTWGGKRQALRGLSAQWKTPNACVTTVRPRYRPRRSPRCHRCRRPHHLNPRRRRRRLLRRRSRRPSHTNL